MLETRRFDGVLRTVSLIDLRGDAELGRAELRPERPRLALAGGALGEEDFELQLVGHFAAIREYLQILDHRKRQAQRYGLESGLEADQFGALGGWPIEVFGGIAEVLSKAILL